MVQECRGLILDAKANWAVVAFPYTKFFNYGEPRAHPIDWSTAHVTEKIDGSLLTLYWHAEEWHVATSSTPDARGETKTPPLTFAELFWDIWARLRYVMPIYTHCSYIFEMITPRNPIVIHPLTDDLLLHGVRDNLSLYEMDPVPVAAAHGWHAVPAYQFNTMDDVIATSKRIDATAHEGFVVRDATFQRVKVKAPQYVALAHMLGRGHVGTHVDSKHMLQIVRTNEGDEFLSHFPEHSQLYTQVKTAYDLFLLTAPEDRLYYVDADLDDLYKLLRLGAQLKGEGTGDTARDRERRAIQSKAAKRAHKQSKHTHSSPPGTD